MRKILVQLVQEMEERARKLFEQRTSEMRVKLIKTYNKWQEDEHDGVDYIFDLSNKDDLVCCIQGGLNAADIANMYNEAKLGEKTPYFFFGQNYPEPKQIDDYGKLADILFDNMYEILPYVIARPDIYEDLWGELVTNYMSENRMI